ncbi:MAG: hypothetical protein HXX09_08520 [Bacteroidetes bacterium]|nr:hypothetical protein [Bacteroidota bacterium]
MKISNEIKIIGIYCLLFIFIIIGFQKFYYTDLLNSTNFLNWDAEHYFWIKNNGYQGFRIAFFPFFPFLWKGLSFGIFGIVIFNASLYIASFYFLIRKLKAKAFEVILYLSIPSSIFFYLPYTESVFFASSTILLFGLINKKTILVFLGLLLCSISRPAFMVFIPALIIAELLSEKLNLKLFFRLGFYFLSAILGILIVGIIQHHYTGNWFEFFSVQSGWGNKLQIPKFPLSSWAGGLIVRLDGAALLFGTAAGIILILKIFKAKFLKDILMPKEVIFSFCYLAGMALSVFIFRGGSLFSLNRFLFATPFIIVAANYFFKQNFSINKKNLGLIFFLFLLFWLSFGSYGHLRTFLLFLALSIYLFLFVGTKTNNQLLNKISLILLILVNFIFQILFFIRFMNGGWVG